ncbi:MAG: ABC transporter permease subunit [Pseudomonadota bacterium]|nr:ABC transporter permease subunit [Pseudomonadota bacterium]
MTKTATTAIDELKQAEQGTSLWTESFYRFKKNKMAVLSIFYLLIQALMAIFAPMLTSYSYEATDLMLGAVAPSSEHWFGTDELGRDIFTRTLYGARISLAIGLLAVVVSLVIGIIYGAVSGYFGGKVDYYMQRFLEILYAIPFMILVIILLTMFGHNIFMLFIALGAIQWLTMARIVRGQVISLKEMEFVEAARCMGVGRLMIIMRHMIPNILGPVIVYTTLAIPALILEEAFLSFLGLGVQEPMSSWGTLISDGVEIMEEHPWALVFPSLTLMLTLLALNFLGDGLRDALDPKVSQH